MALIGAILGDIAGSQYEFRSSRPKTGIDSWTCPLYTDRCVFTDDTVLTLAIKKAVLENADFADTLKEVAKKYKYVGYGTFFHSWLYSDSREPANSFGNGTAMRISFLADHYPDVDEMQAVCRKSAACTHIHPEGIKGAVVSATCMWRACHGSSREEILQYACEQYPKDRYPFGCERPIAEYRDTYQFDASCQGSVPVAIRCFYEGRDYESCLRNAFSLNCDLDTVCCIAGGIAENFYGTTGFDNAKLLARYLDDFLLELVYR